MVFERSSGILLHPTSLPGGFGIGDFGAEARRFVDFLAASNQSLWQILPLGPTGYGDSPYQSFSAFAGNTLLISLERLVEDELLSRGDLSRAPSFSDERVDFERVIEFKNEILNRAFENFRHSRDKNLHDDFETFSKTENSWLDDYALFRAVKNMHGGAAWNKWEKQFALRDEQALREARERLHSEIAAQKFYQYLFFKQWSELKTYARERNIQIIGDVPIFVAHDSADVWTHRELFKLNLDGSPRVVSGVPPDFFSPTGQRWGNPLYDWARMQADNFAWWVERMRATLRTVDIIRLDHFRGFAAAWEVPGEDETAERGRWVDAPGRELFTALKRSLGDLPIIAEDLGVITPDVERLRDDFNFPGMRVLQFAFGGDWGNPHLPHNYTKNSAVYTGTHDNDTTVGWFNSGAGTTQNNEQLKREREFCLEYLKSNGAEIHWDFIRAAMESVADLCIVPLQDVLGLGTEARMNLPATKGGNWSWRFKQDALTDVVSGRLGEITEICGRRRV
jgi:4-alpha-glucanotransferase